MPECNQFCHPVQRYAATQCKVMLPTFGDHQRVCKVSSTPEALGAAVAVRSRRYLARVQESKVAFADDTTGTRDLTFSPSG
jgi:hypothetical protein